jgi:hypothetical protein
MLKGVGATLAGGGLVAVQGVEDVMASTQSEVRTLLESWSENIRIKDIDRLMSLYSPDIIYFDVVPLSSTPDLLRSGVISCGGLMAGRAQSAWNSAT